MKYRIRIPKTQCYVQCMVGDTVTLGPKHSAGFYQPLDYPSPILQELGYEAEAVEPKYKVKHPSLGYFTGKLGDAWSWVPNRSGTYYSRALASAVRDGIVALFYDLNPDALTIEETYE